jgi:endonuclease YncB( thermonuclease family)
VLRKEWVFNVAGQWEDIYNKGGSEYVRAIDGDTIDIESHGLRYPTRLEGIDSPEIGMPDGEEAMRFVNRLIRKSGPLKVVSRKKDPYGRNVSVVMAGDKNVNYELVRAGYAKVEPKWLEHYDPRFKEGLLGAQNAAQSESRGIWGSGIGEKDFGAWRRYDKPSKVSGYGELPPGAPISIGEWIRKDLRVYEGSVLARQGKGGKRSKVPYGERFPGEEGWLMKVLHALDYPGNIVRSGLYGAQDGRTWEYMAEAAKKERYTSEERLRKTYGWGNVGKSDGKFEWADLADIGSDLLVGIATDPLTWVTGGLSAVGKAGAVARTGKVARGAESISAGMRDYRLGLDTKAAINYGRFKHGTAMALGGMYGAGTADTDDEWYVRLGRAAAGAGLGHLGIRHGAKLKTAAGKGMDKISDWYAVRTKGEEFVRFTENQRVAKTAFAKVEKVAEWIKQKRFKALDGLAPEEITIVNQIMHDLKNEWVSRVNKAEESLKGKHRRYDYRPIKMDPKKYPPNDDTGTKWIRTIDDDGVLQHYGSVARNLNLKRMQITETMAREYKPKVMQRALAGLEETQKNRITNAITTWEKNNENVIRNLNRVRKDVASAQPNRLFPDGSTGLVGIRWHIDDIVQKKDLDELIMTERSWRIHRKRMAATAKHNMDPDMAYGIYAENFASRFLKENEQKAVEFMQRFRETPAGKMEYFHKFLDQTDKMTNFIKGSMLYMTFSWLKNNYWDNLAKSYVVNGFDGLLDTATMGALQKGTYKDISDIYRKQFNRKYSSDDLAMAFEDGVLDNPMFRAMTDPDTEKFLYTSQQLEKMKNQNRGPADWILGKVAKMEQVTRISKFKEGVMRTGSHMEGTARLFTYLRNRDAMVKSGVKLSDARKMARKVVADTFFDYSQLHHLENALFKRVIPFYSFYSKNLGFWMKATVDPQMVGRIAAVERTRRNLGSDPSQHQLGGMTPYLTSNAPRTLGKDQNGDMVYMIAPTTSAYDAYNMAGILMGNWETAVDVITEKGHPVPKMFTELVADKDFFTGGKMWASSQDGGKKYLFSRGMKWAVAKEAADLFDVDLARSLENIATADSRGNVTTKNDYVVALDKLLSTFYPHGVVDQLIGSMGKVVYGKEKLHQAVLNNISPIRQVKVSKDYARLVRKQRRREND